MWETIWEARNLRAGKALLVGGGGGSGGVVIATVAVVVHGGLWKT